MTDEQGYNGWTNYETWAAALWIDNERSTYEWALELAASVLEDVELTEHGRLAGDDRRRAASDLGDLIRAELEEAMPDLEASLWSDLLVAAFYEIDWRELAEHYIATALETLEHDRPTAKQRAAMAMLDAQNEGADA